MRNSTFLFNFFPFITRKMILTEIQIDFPSKNTRDSAGHANDIREAVPNMRARNELRASRSAGCRLFVIVSIVASNHATRASFHAISGA